MNHLSTFAKEHKFLFWDIPEKALDTISQEAILERTLAYGDMKEIKQLFNIIGVHKSQQSFSKIIKKKRVNLKPSTINYFRLYFENHAS